MFVFRDRGTRKAESCRSRKNRRFECLEDRRVLSVAPTVSDIAVSSLDWDLAFVDYVNTSQVDGIGYSIPTGSASQTDPLPWNNLNQLKITFSEDVNVDAADLSLTGVNSTQYSVDSFFYDAITHVAIWTFSSYLSADRYMIDLDADGIDPVADLDGNVLDGEWTDEVSTSSGNGTAGGDFEFSFAVLPGDVDQSGLVNTWDYLGTRLLTGQGTTSPSYSELNDVDGSGQINVTDWMDIIGRFATSTPSGAPAAASSDTPSVQGIDLIDIDDAAVDVAISLFGAFEDNEDSDSQMTYQIVGNTDPSLLDTLVIDSLSGELTISADSEASAGRTNVTVRATDSDGLSVETTVAVDVFRNNQAPIITNYTSSELIGNTWIISGIVSDGDDDVEGMIVNFSGLFEIRATVDSTGYFEFAVVLDPSQSGLLDAIVADPHGLESSEVSVYLGLT